MRKLFPFIFGIGLLVGSILLPISMIAAQNTPAACPGAPAPRLAPGMTAQPAQSFSSLRADLDSNDVLTVMQRINGDTFSILSGPTCASGPFNWYQVNFKGTIGWVTEGTDSTYWVEPVTTQPVPPSTATPVIPPPIIPPTPVLVAGQCLGAPVPRLKVGQVARPAQTFSSLRDAIGSPNVLFLMMRSAGDTFTVMSGPSCGTAPVNWYQVNFKGTVGWVSEGTGDTYWVEPVQ